MEEALSGTRKLKNINADAASAETALIFTRRSPVKNSNREKTGSILFLKRTAYRDLPDIKSVIASVKSGAISLPEKSLCRSPPKKLSDRYIKS